MSSSALGSQSIALLTLPAGTLIDYAGTVEPIGWLLCDGRAVSRTSYASLFSAISTSYGAGDGSTTFNIPDFRGRFARYNDNMGTVAGAAGRDSGRAHLVKEHQITVEAGANAGNKQFSKLEINDASFGVAAQTGTQLIRFSGANYANDTRNNDSTYTRIVKGGDIDAVETRPVNLSCNRIIKY
jgi:microcystin-dependent protein